jgi:hypothetical protein
MRHGVTTLRAASKAAAYEHTMLRACTRLLTTRDLQDALPDRVVLDTVGSLYLPTGVRIHARCLIEFFFYPPHPTYVRASDFLADPLAWSGRLPGRTRAVSEAEEKASALAAHVSVRRIELIEAGERSWNFDAVFADLDVIWRMFLEHALPDRLHPDLVPALT